MTFEDAMQLTRTISSNTAFEDIECRQYFDILMSLPEDALIVEVGLEYGRSSSIALQVAKEKRLRYVGIDPFEGPWEGGAADRYWLEMSKRVGMYYSLTLHRSRSSLVQWFREIDAILIDGDHSYDGVRDDCEHFLPYVKGGGFAMFHDYNREGLPDVTRAVDRYMERHREFSHIKTAGTLGVWRRL